MISRIVVVVTTTDDCASEAAGRVRLPINSGSDSHQLLVPDEKATHVESVGAEHREQNSGKDQRWVVYLKPVAPAAPIAAQ